MNHSCTIRGLSAPDSGIGAANTAAKGVARVDANTAPTNMYLTLENADYTRVNANVQVNGADSSLVLLALESYETW